MNSARKVLSLAGAGILIATLAACGGDDGDSEGNANPENTNAPSDAGTSQPWILGTTDPIVSIDPAGAYDIGSWNLQYSVYEQLLTIPAGGDEPEPDAAESCEYTDPQKVTCTLRADNTFSNGSELTSSDVKFSFERNIAIADPNGASTLLGSIIDPDSETQTIAEGAIETPDDTTVVFNLNKPDLTFIKILTTAATSIVDEETFPADKLQPSDQVIGSGPYTVEQYVEQEQVALAASSAYTGARSGKANQVVVKLYTDPSSLRSDIGTKKVDVAWRTLSPTDLADLGTTDGLTVSEGEGSEFRYWVWQFSNPAPQAARGAPGCRLPHRPCRDHPGCLRRHHDAGVLDRAAGLPAARPTRSRRRSASRPTRPRPSRS